VWVAPGPSPSSSDRRDARASTADLYEAWQRLDGAGNRRARSGTSRCPCCGAGSNGGGPACWMLSYCGRFKDAPRRFTLFGFRPADAGGRISIHIYENSLR